MTSRRVAPKNQLIEERAQRFRVLRTFSGYEPGQIVETSSWPFGRAALLVRQRYLMPVGD